jgi:hypothetical protein
VDLLENFENGDAAAILNEPLLCYLILPERRRRDGRVIAVVAVERWNSWPSAT